MNPWAKKDIELLESDDFWSANNKTDIRDIAIRLIVQYRQLDRLLTTVLEADK